MRRLTSLLISATLLTTMLVTIGPSSPATTTSPVATSEEEYLVYGRVFPDPHGCNAAGSPFAKGQVCATDFLQFSEFEGGMTFLEDLFPRFLEFHRLDEDFACSGKPVSKPDDACKKFLSAGLPVTANQSGEGFTRDRRPLYMVRVTDETISDKKKEYFVFALGMHGIERAGVEGGTRAAEDLATWAACEVEELDVCANEQPIPHPILEATPKKSLTALDVLEKSVIYFMYPNPDGWLRGDRTSGAQFYQRYNGNGVDINRDWPEQGFTFRPYTPWSEPETLAFGRVLQAIGPHDSMGDPKWTGGIDLHGQLIDVAYSFTLLGASERPYDKNQRILQTVKGAWRDAEGRLAWSPLIKPNDAPEDDPRMYGVQWGTIWDTIDYTVTGALGNWMDSPIGLNADGIDNEMSLSHVGNCGVGSCWEQDVEQLHVDGNKSLIYSMVNFSLKPENTTFKATGKVAYLHNKGFVQAKSKSLKSPPKFAKLPPQEDIADMLLNQTNEFIHQFKVKGPSQKVYNGGIAATITCGNAQGVGNCALTEARLERKKVSREANTQGEEWETVNSYFNQSPLYVQAGQALHANLPTPGQYRVRIEGAQPIDQFRLDIDFTKEKAWPDPGQVGYKVTSMNFWEDLQPFSKPRIAKVTAREVAKTKRWRNRYDTIVITNESYPKIADKLRRWVARKDGNLVLLDSAINMLGDMNMVKGGFAVTSEYAGYTNFASRRRENTYKDVLAKKIDLPGAAEGNAGGETHRRQTYEPVPIGISLQTADGGDANNSPVWYIKAKKFKKARGVQRAVGTTRDLGNISYGEIKWLGGRIRFLGALLPDPSEEFDHPYGLANYSITYAGYQLLKNMFNWKS